MKLTKRIRRDYFPGRSPELIAVPKEPNDLGGFIGTSHSGLWDDVQEVPVVFFGSGHIRPWDRSRWITKQASPIQHPHSRNCRYGFPDDRPGQSISEALRSNPEHPKLVVVWDGGGTNMLETFPDAWPNLSRIMEAGTWVTATVGS